MRAKRAWNEVRCNMEGSCQAAWPAKGDRIQWETWLSVEFKFNLRTAFYYKVAASPEDAIREPTRDAEGKEAEL